ncbi:hypothetical protein [Massilia antarctica]|uniref:hypothetical protein n=1 Tax=Massilia antarctica TaxID=2765360 RepID=UPI0006BC7FA3|nr:hypothetical protein [Massilia sp. H27-R4]MCY0913706.1 hypothetical protein [Massilia sp. H27-R4]CUI04619.1 FOG: HEAT repeat [Janthinobacterium sp. CG23_2]CUU28405.1 FOG: HEAT repeat [Janthinobacterium sp. CG23_2]
MQLQQHRQVIPAMVRRHVEDTAFYWSQYDVSEQSFTLSLSDLIRFNGALQAHLDGIAVAGSGAWPFALAALERWNKPGEAFACTYAAILDGDPARLDLLAAHIQAGPDALLRGAISALAWAPWSAAERAIARWSAPGAEPVMLVAALRALNLINQCLVSDPASTDSDTWLQTPLPELLASPNAHVRAAACRLAAQADEDEQVKQLVKEALHDGDLAVRAQAAIAVARLARDGAYASRFDEQADHELRLRSVDTLRHCVASQVALLAGASGWFAKQARRRLERWVEHLAWMIEPGSGELAPMLATMPVRSALHFVACHGDPAHLPFVVHQMNDPATARYAGWVWQVISGVDIVGAGLILAEPATSADATLDSAPVDADFGLVLPNGAAIARHRLSLPAGERCINGQPADHTSMLEIMEGSSQAIRRIAAQHLQSLEPLFMMPVRAPAAIQLQCADTIDALMDLEHAA